MSRVRLTAFAGIGVLAALQWGTLLADPPIARLLGAVAVATLLGWALGRVGAASWHDRRLARGLAVLGLVAVATIGSLLVLGLPLRALPPWGWDRLGDGLDVGLTGLGGSFDYPFHGAGEWARLLLVVPLVPLTIAAAVLTFRPGRAPGRVPIAGLLTLIVAFAIPAAARPTGLPAALGRGAAVAGRRLALGRAGQGAPRDRPRRRVRGRRDPGRDEPRRRRPAGRLPLVDPARRRGGDDVRLGAAIRPDRLAADGRAPVPGPNRPAPASGAPRCSTSSTPTAGAARAPAGSRFRRSRSVTRPVSCAICAGRSGRDSTSSPSTATW